ncbi:MAG TPA: DUF3987 domain-containing protein [Candidatus Wunengus sp. YC60]|uniref:DUF3987 domain-containing protein n=1 Tax=Candidatus Wunengus sp. YC60 TaxID=3367697 RepID=UPI0040294DD4
MNKQHVLDKINFADFYQELIPSLKINGKPEALGLCCFHNDHNPSLSVNVETGLFRCFSCGIKGDVFTFYQKFKDTDFPTALKEIAEMVNIGTDVKPQVVATFQYADEAGNVLYTKERIEPGRNGRSKEFVFKHMKGDRWVLGRGCEPVLYRLPEIIKSTYCFVVEGEAKADLLTNWGFVAACLDSGANSLVRDEYIQILGRMEKVIILPDNDTPGKSYASKIASALHGRVKELKVVGLPGLKEKEDVIDWAKIPSNDKVKLAGIVKNTSAWSPDSEVKVKVVNVVTGNLIPVYKFPIGIFPDKFKRLVDKLSISIDIAPEVIATIALTILSASIGNAVRISSKKGYYVPPFLWAAIVLPTGSGKSPVMSELVKPVRKMQSQAYLKYKDSMKEYEAKLLNFKHDKSKVKTSPPEVPTMKQFYVTDSTVEALADVFEVESRGVLNFQDELSGLILGLNQYKSGGNDQQQYLDIFNCSPMKIDRKNKSRFIPHTGMAISGGIQPLVLPKVFGDDSFHDGFIQRFIFVCPESQPLRFSRETLGNEMEYWEDLLYWCFEIPLELNDSGFINSKILTLSPDALNLWEKFYNEYGHLASILPARVSGFIPKLYLYSLKFAGLLHFLNSFDNKDILPVINEKTISDAISLVAYYFGQISRVLRLYSKKQEKKEYHMRITKAINNLRNEVTNGKLELSKIIRRYNEGLPAHAHLTAEKMSNILNRELGLETKRSTGNYSYLIWEDGKINNLLETSLTSFTTLTENPPVEDVPEVADYDDNIPDDDKNFKELVAFFEEKKNEEIVDLTNIGLFAEETT